MAKRAKGSKDRTFWNTASQAPSAISLAIGFLMIALGLISSTLLAFLINVFGFILIISGLVGIYLLGGAHRK